MAFEYYQISKKSNYAIEALIELAFSSRSDPENARNIAKARNIPVRFLEVILNELKQGGFVRSVRGKTGGYMLTESPNSLNIGQVLLFLEKISKSEAMGYGDGSVALKGLMSDVNKAIADLFECTTLQDLVEKESLDKENYIANYSI